MGKVKELLYKEQNPQFDAEDAYDDYEPQWAGDEPKQTTDVKRYPKDNSNGWYGACECDFKELLEGNTEYESKLAELKADNEFLSFCKNALDSAYAEIKELTIDIARLKKEQNKLQEDNEKLKLSEEEKRLLKNIWRVADGTGFPSIQPMSNERLIEKLI